MSDYFEEDLDVDGVLEALDAGPKRARIEFGSAVKAAEPAQRKAARAWVAGVAEAALNLRAPSKPGDIRASYWTAIGDQPRSLEEHERTIAEVLEALKGQPVPLDLTEAIASLQYVDRSSEPDHVLQQGLLYELARIRLEALEDEVARLRAVYPFALAVALSPSIEIYLARVARLFVLGMDVEVAALARAALEAALTDTQAEDAVRNILSLPATTALNLTARIRAARTSGLLSDRGEEFATLIRVRGNQSLHGGAAILTASGGPLGIVWRLSFCLGEISRSRPATETHSEEK